ncbi:hypothetical protein E8E12_007343 [Didymella heteroderae]|uniref:Uncharacterized protein n=1 Tax=Didymella heteroderae TaxID=1769908 RepID=A0A9P4WLE2_9PLEO|nr:hypothetical protein E8E12_007343 [Didymella heteroderae]
MAGPRTNLAVTKDGESYNKLQRPTDFLDQSAASKQANERKREHGGLDAPVAGPSAGNKRAKTQHAGQASKAAQSSDDRSQYRSGGPVAECGMRTTLPIDEEEAQYSDDSWGDALAYLRSVRSEASAIPHLLVATNEPSETTTKGDEAPIARTSQHTFYRDGTWIAVDESHGAANNDDDDDDYKPDDPDPKDLYHRQLLKRFETLRNTLSRRGAGMTSHQHANPTRLSSSKPPYSRHEWLYTIDREYPRRSQIYQLDELSVRRGLEYCAHALDRFETISSQKSCWIWTLLALSGDVGTMDSQKISHIRDLGTKAGDMSVGLRSNATQQGKEPQSDSDHTDSVSLEQIDETEAARCDCGSDVSKSQTGYVQSRVSEHLHLEAKETHNDMSKAQHDLPSDLASSGASKILTNDQESTNAKMSDDDLERARARLLAQLGDNLVQAGIPASVPDIGDIHPHHSAQHDLGFDDSPAEIRVRAIPSRAEAERQRQLMRAESSATASLEETQLLDTRHPATTHSVESVDKADDFDLNTRVTIDMILTVVAECYGQRDLLTFRKPW